jgi:hypothetical protein
MKKKKSVAVRGPAAKPVHRTADFPVTFLQLKRVFAPFVRRLQINADTRGRYYLETKSQYRGRPMFFGAVISGRAYVSFHLMPLYWDPSLLARISPALKKRMQGKSCFNFTSPDPVLFRELGKLTSKGFALYRKKNLV